VNDTQRHYCDAALVGFPDAGKSTLFNALTGRDDSRKMPRYSPIRGGRRGAVLADIGGISRGGRPENNPGSQWLKYVTQARLLVFVLALDSQNIPPERIARSLEFLRAAVFRKDPALAGQARLAVLNRFCGVPEEAAAPALALLRGRGETALCVCAAAPCGAQNLIQGIEHILTMEEIWQILELT
jgi:GTPase involved in cell partitioning and DNA repair